MGILKKFNYKFSWVSRLSVCTFDMPRCQGVSLAILFQNATIINLPLQVDKAQMTRMIQNDIIFIFPSFGYFWINDNWKKFLSPVYVLIGKDSLHVRPKQSNEISQRKVGKKANGHMKPGKWYSFEKKTTNSLQFFIECHKRYYLWKL